MMRRFDLNPLIPTQPREIGGVLQETVDARDLWAFFKPHSMFAGWMRAKLIQHKSFLEGRDFARIKVQREIQYWRHSRISHQVDYVMTVAMAEAIGGAEFCRGPNPWK